VARADSSLRRVALIAAALLIVVRTAQAQVIAGQVVEAHTGEPLRAYPVRLVALAAADSVHACDSTLTDERGLFQMPGRGRGRYRVEFGPSGSRLETSAEFLVAHEDTTIEGRYAVPVLELAGAEAFASRNVQKVARVRAVVPVHYPRELRDISLTGEVVVRFVVDVEGNVRPGSVEVVRSSHPGFTRSVLDALRTMQFVPARVGGIAVPQVIEEPFTFTIESR
jgi:TonB family protein